jgi:hypothetical protein
MAVKKGNKSERYEPIPYASEQGIFCGPCREFKSAIKEIAALIRESALVRHLGPPNPILREISKVAREGQRGAPPDCSRSRGPRQRELARRARAATLAIRCFAPGRRGSSLPMTIRSMPRSTAQERMTSPIGDPSQRGCWCRSSQISTRPG